jgi:acetolactate synthase-1/3 small subunit
MHIKQELTERHVLTLTVDNEAGTLARIAGMFTSRGYNIDSLTVADISEDHTTSRITIVTKGPPPVIDQIIAQCERLIPVHKVTDLTEAGPHVERELALVKVNGTGDQRVEAMRLADIYRARVIDATVNSFIFKRSIFSERNESLHVCRRHTKSLTYSLTRLLTQSLTHSLI